MTLAHTIYALGALAVIAAMLMRKGVVVPALIATFAVGWAYKGGFVEGIIGGATAIYNANIMAAKELFGIILLIAFMVAMLNALKKIGADYKMITPVQKLMVNGHVAYWVLVVATTVISTTFWPTPAIPLVAAILMPAAMKAGLPPMGIAVAVTLSGQGMALAADALMQVAPSLSAKAAGSPDLAGAIWSKGIILSLITGVVATGLSYIAIRKSIRKPEDMGSFHVLEGGKAHTREQGLAEAAAAVETLDPKIESLSKIFAVLTVGAFALVVLAMFVYDINGGDAGALIGGTAALIMIAASFAGSGKEAFEDVATRLTEGFGFAMKIMGSIIPIAAFFFLGGKDHSAAVFGENAPGFLFDMVNAMQAYIPHNEFIAAFGVMMVGVLIGIDGSGFAGLPITGALSGALAHGSGMDVSMLAALGQMGSIWSGGGTIVAWSSLVAVAGFAGVSAVDLARRNFIPVMAGLTIATILAVLIW